MVILVDTNILMDVIANREPYAEYGKRILEKCAKREVAGIMAAKTGAEIDQFLPVFIDWELLSRPQSAAGMLR